MFDENKLKQLQNKSHVRGKLNKEFYSLQQEQLQRKRRQMKLILDQQVQQKRRQKQKQKYEQDKKIQLQQQKIKAYYMQIQQREKKPSNPSNSGAYGQLQNSNVHNKFGKVGSSGVYQSRTVVHDSYNNYLKQNISDSPNALRSKSRTKNYYDSGDIPVMPVMQSPQKDKQKNIHNLQNSSGQQKLDKQYMVAQRSSVGNMPLLQLTQQQQKRQKKKSKRNPTKKDQKQKVKQKERRPTIADQQHLLPNSRQKTQFKQIFGDLNEQIQQENKQLKKQLKKKEEAISLLMGAVRSNAKLDKFRIQAQKILHGQNSMDAKIVPVTQQSRVRKQSVKDGHDVQQVVAEKQSMLPRLKLHHQSMMHDYMFGSARRAHILKARTFK